MESSKSIRLYRNSIRSAEEIVEVNFDLISSLLERYNGEKLINPKGTTITSMEQLTDGERFIVVEKRATCPPEVIMAAARELLEEHREAVLEQRYRFPVGPRIVAPTMAKLAKEHGKIDGGSVKRVVDGMLLELLGPRTAEDNKKRKAAPAPKPKAAPAAAQAPASDKMSADPIAETNFPVPTENRLNTAEILAQHVAVTGGKTITRFPPEPNGYLHIGHCKAMFLDFGFAMRRGGETILRFDDTNPGVESQEYIDAVKADVEWLGFHPVRVTYTSDYFDQLHAFAVQLIRRGLAYVDFSSKEEIRAGREQRMNSRYRDTPVEENLKHFEDMRKGKYEEGAAVLRCKINMQSDNPCMRDFIAYRIKYQGHHHAGDKWCIYPSYDFSHCVVDSLENITQSLCTIEFEIRQESYYWLLDALNLYKPIVWEMSRLNVTHGAISKRKLLALVNNGIVSGWDDPRLFTIKALRRRGFTPESLHEFVHRVGFSRTENLIRFELLEHCLRLHLDSVAPRAMAVLDPLRVVITNWGDGPATEIIEAPVHPKHPERGTRRTPLSRVLYVDRSDFRDVDSKSFFGLAPGKEAGLKYAFNITCTRVITDESGKAVELLCECDRTRSRKVKGHLSWVSAPEGEEPLHAEVREFGQLFPADVTQVRDWAGEADRNSLTVHRHALVDATLRDVAPEARFQFERMGYFCVDTDTRPGRLVINKITSLRDSRPV